MELKTRSADIADLRPVTDLILKCSEKFILPEFTDEGRATYRNSHSLELMTERLRTFDYEVLESSAGQIIGVAGIRDRSHLYHLHIAPEFHGKGLGRRLCKHALSKNQRLWNTRLFTVNSSRFAVPFYEKLGFTGSEETTSGGVIYFPMQLKP